MRKNRVSTSVPPRFEQYQNQGNRSNLVQSYFGSPASKWLESGISSTTGLLPRVLGSEPATPLSHSLEWKSVLKFTWTVGRAASGVSIALEPPHATRRQPASIRIFWGIAFFWKIRIEPLQGRKKEKKRKEKKEKMDFAIALRFYKCKSRSCAQT